MLGAMFATFSHILLGSRPLCVLGRIGLQYPDMPVRRTCLEGITAVDTEGRPCISLKNFTERTFIHYARTPETTYMYCSIPKNGCSYHIDMLHRVRGDYFPGRLKHLVVNKRKIMFTNEQKAATLLSDSRVPKYMVIRNPMTRTLSGYLCKVESLLPEIEKTPARFRRWAQDEFANLTSWEKVNSHWRAQTEFCGYGMRDIQKRFHVFRVEEPEGYVDFLYKIIPSQILEKGWGDNSTNFRDFVLSPHKRTGNTEAKFYEYVGNLKTFDLLERTFRKDIDTLGYREQVTEMRRVLVDITRNAEQRTMRIKT